MKRTKVPDYRDKAVFGVPLIIHVQRTGQPLPQSIQQALRYLRSNCLDQVGSSVPGTGQAAQSASQIRSVQGQTRHASLKEKALLSLEVPV